MRLVVIIWDRLGYLSLGIEADRSLQTATPRCAITQKGAVLFSALRVL